MRLRACALRALLAAALATYALASDVGAGGAPFSDSRVTSVPSGCGVWSSEGPGGPSAHAGLCGAWDIVKQRLFVFGGLGAGGVSAETWSYSPVSGWNPITVDVPPAPRYGAAMVYGYGKPLMFGGLVSSGGNPPVRTDEVWEFIDLGGPEVWASVNVGSGPAPRNGASMVVGQGGVLVFGGEIGDSVLSNEVWRLDPSAGPYGWFPLTPAVSPPARAGHAAIYDTARDRMVVYGGSSVDPETVWAFSPSSMTWSTVAVVGSPHATANLSAVYDPIRDRMIVAGGGSSEISVLAFETPTPVWSRLEPNDSLSPDPRTSPLLVRDWSQDRLLLLGGSGTSGPLLSLDFTGGFDVDAGGDHGTVSTLTCYEPNSDAMLDAAPAAGYQFDHWLGDAAGSANPLTITVDGYKAIQAVFVPAPVSVPASPAVLELREIRPNPSAGSVHFDFSISSRTRVRFRIVDLAGREVARLLDGAFEAGTHGTEWNAVVRGSRVPPGIYFARLETDGAVCFRRFATLR